MHNVRLGGYCQQWCATGLRATCRLLSFGIGCLLLYSGVIHASNDIRFYQAVCQYQLLPDGAAIAVATFLPELLLLTGFFLVVGFWMESALVVAAVTFSVFGLATGITWVRGMSIDCGCFGSHSQPVDWKHSLGNFLLTVTCVLLFVQLGKHRAGSESVVSTDPKHSGTKK